MNSCYYYYCICYLVVSCYELAIILSLATQYHTMYVEKLRKIVKLKRNMQLLNKNDKKLKI